jgi:hypothetical protein
MNRSRFTLGIFILAGALACSICAAEAAPATQRVAVDDATAKKLDQKAQRIVDLAKIDNPERAARVKALVNDWLVTMTAWHKDHDAELNELWAEWNKARSVVTKDEFPGECVAYRIDQAYAPIKPTYEVFINKLAGDLTGEQIDAIKESWSRSPGMTRTYNAYLEIVPDLSDKDKQVIKNRMLMAREAAMLTDSDKEIVAIYKIQKVKVEQYIGALEWSKLHKAYANRAKPKADEQK